MGENFAFFIFCTGSGETPGELGGARVDGGSGSRWAEITLTLRANATGVSQVLRRPKHFSIEANFDTNYLIVFHIFLL